MYNENELTNAKMEKIYNFEHLYIIILSHGIQKYKYFNYYFVHNCIKLKKITNIIIRKVKMKNVKDVFTSF